MFDTSILVGKKIAFTTLGCKLNFAESSSLANQLREYGATTVAKGEKADICVINTCTVTEVADRKGRQAINRVIRENPGALVVVTGCYAQLNHSKLSKITGVDVVIGAEHKNQVIPMILSSFNNNKPTGDYEEETSVNDSKFFHACSFGDRTRYFLKVQDGCNYFCTYCTIPFARGRSRNGSVKDIVKQATNVANKGGKEIVLTGVNIGDFGRSTGEDFFQLIKELDKVRGIERYRISSIEPNLLTDEIIDFCANSNKFMPHFHIPLQSGSDEVLRLMRRRYDTQFFADKVERVKKVMPYAFIGVDVMVGCRGEKPEFFQQAYNFIDSLDISHVHVFTYSERPGTDALNIPFAVSPEEKHERCRKLMELSDNKTTAFYRKFQNTTRPVLFEHSRNNKIMGGFTDNYIRVEAPASKDMYNTIQNVTIGDLNTKGDAMRGAVV